ARRARLPPSGRGDRRAGALGGPAPARRAGGWRVVQAGRGRGRLVRPGAARRAPPGAGERARPARSRDLERGADAPGGVRAARGRARARRRRAGVLALARRGRAARADRPGRFVGRDTAVDSSAVPPPYRIETERLVVRCWEPRDAPLLKDAVDSSIEHLMPWMPWAVYEPQSLQEKVDLLRQFRGNFDLGKDFVYGIFDGDESEALGGTGLHTRVGDQAYEIGYWMRASRTGSGFGTEATAALTRVAFELTEVERIEIRCDPAN